MGQKDLPVASGEKHAKVFQSIGWMLTRSKKSHYVLSKSGNEMISFPDHNEVARNLLQAELRKAGVSLKDYLIYYNMIF